MKALTVHLRTDYKILTFLRLLLSNFRKTLSIPSFLIDSKKVFLFKDGRYSKTAVECYFHSVTLNIQ